MQDHFHSMEAKIYHANSHNSACLLIQTGKHAWGETSVPLPSGQLKGPAARGSCLLLSTVQAYAMTFFRCNRLLFLLFLAEETSSWIFYPGDSTFMSAVIVPRKQKWTIKILFLRIFVQALHDRDGLVRKVQRCCGLLHNNQTMWLLECLS